MTGARPRWDAGFLDRTALAHRVDAICRLTGEFTLRPGQPSTEYFDKYCGEGDVAAECGSLLLGVGDARAGHKPAALFLHAPRGADFVGGVLERQDGLGLGAAAFGQGVVAAHQQQLVGPGQVTGHGRGGRGRPRTPFVTRW